MTIIEIQQILKYCAQHNLSLKSHLSTLDLPYHRFKYWKNKLLDQVPVVKPKSGFVELPAKIKEHEIVFESPNGWKVRLNMDLKTFMEHIQK